MLFFFFAVQEYVCLLCGCVCVGLCVCMYVCMYACMYVMYICMNQRTYICTYDRVYVRVYGWMSTPRGAGATPMEEGGRWIGAVAQVDRCRGVLPLRRHLPGPKCVCVCVCVYVCVG